MKSPRPIGNPLLRMGAQVRSTAAALDPPALARHDFDGPPDLELLFQQYADAVHRLVSRLLGPGAARADAEDLVQQIFLAAHKGLRRFRGESKPSTWLFGIATRTVFKELRNRVRHRRMVAALEAAAVVEPIAWDHGRRFEDRLELVRVWRCLMQISVKKRAVLILHDVEGFSGPEIAELLEINPSTVHTRLYHARRELFDALEEER